MRSNLGVGIMLLGMLALTGPILGVEPGVTATNTPPPTAAASNPRLLKIDADHKRILAALEDVDKLITHTQAGPDDQTKKLKCIEGNRTRIKSLSDLFRSSRAKLIAAINDDDVARADDEVTRISLAADRAEHLAAEAAKCDNGLPQKLKAPTAEAEPGLEKPTGRVVRRAPEISRPRAIVKRDAHGCLHQENLACLLVQAMDTSDSPIKTTDDCIAALTAQGVQPLGGWKPGQCATLDDLYVIAARAMNLKIENASDPASFGQALRDDGLPVDALLPARPATGAPPALLEAEVRAFFTRGYATPVTAHR